MNRRVKPKIHKITSHKKGPTFKTLFFLPIILSVFGLLFVFESSSIRAVTETGNSFHYLRLQAIWIALGIGIMTFFSFFDYKKLYYLALPMMFTTVLLLVAVLIPGIGQKTNGARRWIDVGFFNLQPTEFAKLATIIYLSSWFTLRERKRFFSFLFLIGVILGLVMLQPDMGTASVIYGLAITIYYLAGVDLQYLLALVPLSILGFVGLIIVAPYRFQRFTAFLHPHKDTQGIAYHINQILISITHGGIFGRGLGASRQKYLFLPEAHTDSIFAIIGEEFGFIGSILLIFAYFVLLYKLYSLYQVTNDRFGKLLVGGIFAFFGLQSIINLAGMVSLMPLTGVPLPFISYGGSHILMSFMLLGITLSVAKRK